MLIDCGWGGGGWRGCGCGGGANTSCNLTFRGPCIMIYSYNKTNSNLFWNRTLHVSDSFSVHHQEYSTVHRATGICHTGYADCLPASSQHNSCDASIAVCTVLDSWWWTEKLSETCRVLFQNKFEKFLHLVGFIIRMPHVMFTWPDINDLTVTQSVTY